MALAPMPMTFGPAPRTTWIGGQRAFGLSFPRLGLCHQSRQRHVLLSSLLRPFSKLDVWSIVVEHFGTLYDYRTGRPAVSEFVVFIGAPLLFGGVTAWRGVLFDTNVSMEC